MRIEVSPGATDLTIVKAGFAPLTTTVTVAAGQQQPVTIELQKVPTVEETVTVSATRTIFPPCFLNTDTPGSQPSSRR